jgi:hypothetical protein
MATAVAESLNSRRNVSVAFPERQAQLLWFLRRGDQSDQPGTGARGTFGAPSEQKLTAFTSSNGTIRVSRGIVTVMLPEAGLAVRRPGRHARGPGGQAAGVPVVPIRAAVSRWGNGRERRIRLLGGGATARLRPERATGPRIHRMRRARPVLAGTFNQRWSDRLLPLTA